MTVYKNNESCILRDVFVDRSCSSIKVCSASCWINYVMQNVSFPLNQRCMHRVITDVVTSSTLEINLFNKSCTVNSRDIDIVSSFRTVVRKHVQPSKYLSNSQYIQQVTICRDASTAKQNDTLASATYFSCSNNFSCIYM